MRESAGRRELSGPHQTAARAAAPESSELAEPAAFPAGAASTVRAPSKVMCREASFPPRGLPRRGLASFYPPLLPRGCRSARVGARGGG